MKSTEDPWTSLGLLLLRLGTAGLLFFGHGWDKIMRFGDLAPRFADPIGLGPELSLALVVFAEVFCTTAIAIGLWTRVASIPIIIFALIAAFIHHIDDPWGKKELALLYLVPAVTLAVTGGGLFSLDAVLFGRKKGN